MSISTNPPLVDAKVEMPLSYVRKKMPFWNNILHNRKSASTLRQEGRYGRLKKKPYQVNHKVFSAILGQLPVGFWKTVEDPAQVLPNEKDNKNPEKIGPNDRA